MQTVLQVLSHCQNNSPPESVRLAGTQVTIGRSPRTDIAIADDSEVSRLHAVIEKISDRWCVRDLGSRNGTFLNGQAVDVQVPLRDGDEVRVGMTRLLVRIEHDAENLDTTGCPLPPPNLTRREREVLLRLLQPAINGEMIGELATPREIADALSVTEAAVRQHLQNLFQKFDIPGHGGRRQVRLANEALRRGAINPVDVRMANRARLH